MNENKVLHRPKIGLVGANLDECVRAVSALGGLIVSPTKVGYIIMTIDCAGLEKKFMLKDRPKRKPGVVLLSSLDQLDELAETDEKTMKLNQSCWNKNGTVQ